VTAHKVVTVVVVETTTTTTAVATSVVTVVVSKIKPVTDVDSKFNFFSTIN